MGVASAPEVSFDLGHAICRGLAGRLVDRHLDDAVDQRVVVEFIHREQRLLR